MSMASVGSAISACGCCRADGDRRDARSREPARPARRAARRATAGTRGAGRRRAGARRSAGARRPMAVRRPSLCANRFRRPTARRTAAGCGRGSRRPRRRSTSTAAVTSSEHRPCERVGQRRRRDAADLQPRRHCPAAVRLRSARRRRSGPRAAASAAITRSVTSSWVSHRRSCRPSLVPARGSDAAGTELAQPCLAGIDVGDEHLRPGDGRGDLSWLIGPSPSPRASRAAGPRSRPGSAPTTRRAPPTAAARRRRRSRPCSPGGSIAPCAAGPSTPRCPTG